MTDESVVAVRDWVLEHRDAVKPLALNAVRAAHQAQKKAAALSADDLRKGWSEVASATAALKAPERVQAGVQEIMSFLKAAPDAQPSGSGLHALNVSPGGSGGAVSPLFWRGCAFGALAAVSSGIGAGGALLACVLVGVFAD